MLEWFLLIIYKKRTQGNIYRPFNRNHFTLHFLLRREGRQMRNIEQLPYQTDKRSHRRSFFKKAVLKNFAMFMGKYLCWCLFLIKPQTFRTSTLLKRGSNTGFFLFQNFCESPILKNICVRLLLNRLCEAVVWNFVCGDSLSKPSWLRNITQIPVAFKPEL